jgi:hypothetical protein
MRKLFITIVLGVLLSVQMVAQISTAGLDKLPKVKSGTTYFVMPDPNSSEAKAYKEVFTKNWTLSKPEFISYSEVDKHIAKGNSFLNVVLISMTGQLMGMTKTDGAGRSTTTEGMKTEQNLVYLDFWIPSDEFIESKKTMVEYGARYKEIIASINMHVDYATTVTAEDIYSPSYNLFSHLKNWGPGIFKNYIQNLNSFFASNEKRGPYQEFLNNNELSKLKSGTLYIPDYVLTKINVFNGKETKVEENELFDGYKLKYKVIPTVELNNKIQTNENFYYLIFIRNSNQKYVNVVNSSTGEIVYSTHQAGAYNMKSGDLKELYKIIMKG